MANVVGSNPVLAVHDLEANARWFVDVLGCEPANVADGWVFCTTGAVMFMLGHCPDAAPAAEIGDHSYIAYLRVGDVDGIYAAALTAGATVLKPPTDEPWGMREMALRAPEGHRFMVGQPSTTAGAD